MRQKLFIGPNVRLLREERGLPLGACAEALGLSQSYLSQIETNQRPVTARVLIALSRVFGVDAAQFDRDDEMRLVADLREATADTAVAAPLPGLPELKLAAATTPALAHQFLALHRAFRRLDERLRMLDDSLHMDGQDIAALLPYEEVRDFFHYRNNYVDEVDTAAEQLAAKLAIGRGANAYDALVKHLRDAFGLEVVLRKREGDVLRRFERDRGLVSLQSELAEPTRVFQLAAQVAELAFKSIFDALLENSGLKSRAALDVARVGLANYGAAALLMPYGVFASTAIELRHDIEQLQRRFAASFEQICHRLSTLQRPNARGVPFYFVRVDQAGNITKRHSATRFQFARFGGACPLWNIHEAFGHPGRIMVQIAEMPDGVRYLCIGRSIVKRSGSYLRPNRHFAVGIGCELTHANQLVYAEGLQLDGPAALIGVSCRICERTECQQRAFPPIGRTLNVPEDERRVLPYTL